MRLTFVFLTAAFISAHATGVAQNVTLSGKDLTLNQIFNAIKKQTGYVLLHKKGALDGTKTVSLSVFNLPLQDVLDIVLKDQPVEYLIEDKTITLSRKASALPPYQPAFLSAVIPISGQVINADGKPIPGVTIRVLKSKNGTTTDNEGRFSLDRVEEGATIEVSAVGFAPLTIRLNRDRFQVVSSDQSDRSVSSDETVTSLLLNTSPAALLIRLAHNTASLNEVVVNKGYYTTTQRSNTGNISKVTSKDIERQPVSSPLMALQGRVPGLLVTPSTGVAGSTVNIQIRGLNSLRTATQIPVANLPLYVINGVVVDPVPLYSNSGSTSLVFSGYDPLAGIDPASIESIEILKDADATAIYGSRGANGVILITTKQGNNKGATDFDLRVNAGYGKMVNRMELLDTKQYMAMRREALANDGAVVGQFDFDLNGFWDSTRYTDWQDVLLGGAARITDVQGAISGGNAFTSFRVSTGVHEEKTVYPGNFGFLRANGTLDVNHSSIDRRFKIGLSINYGTVKNKLFESANLVDMALSLPPNAPHLFHPDGSLNWQLFPYSGIQLASFDNPMAKFRNTNNSLTRNLIANTTLSYKLSSKFDISTLFGLSNVNSEELIKFPISAMQPLGSPKSRANLGMTRRNSWMVEPKITYKTTFGNHEINALAGASLQDNRSAYFSIAGSDYTSDVQLGNFRAAPIKNILADEDNKYRYIAFYARVGYEWNKQFLVNLTGRRDGSSRFGKNRRFGNFGAVAAGWIFTENKFFKRHLRFLEFGKIRASYGLIGNDQIGDYKYYDLYTNAPYHYQNVPSVLPAFLFNPDYSWESTKKSEAAVELGMFNDRVHIELALYRHRSSDQLVDYQLPATTGFSGVNANFNATVQNHGIEFTLLTKNIQSKNFNWSSSFNISKNNNKLIAFPGIENSSYATTFKVGLPLSSQHLYVYKGVNPESGLPELVDLNVDGAFDTNDMVLGNSLVPKFFGGFSNTFSYKRLELSFLFQFSSKKTPRYTYVFGGGRTNVPVEVMGRWRKQGDVTPIPKFTRSLSISKIVASDYAVIDGSFVRLKTLSLSYRLPAERFRAIGLKDCHLYIQGQNLLTITDYTGFDPETGMGMPPLKIVSLGLSAKF